MPQPEPRREDLQAALGARRELGPEYEDAVLDSFLERVDKSIEARVDARVAERAGDRGQLARRPSQRGTDSGLVLGIVSLCTGIPITAIAGAEGLAGVVVAWSGIGVVNLAHAWGRRRAGS